MALGKWILGGLGWTVGGPIGGIVGFLIGKAFEGKKKNASDSPHSSLHGQPHSQPHGQQGDLLMALLVLIAAVMKADGQLKQNELNYVKRFLLKNFSEQKSLEMLSALRDILKQDIPVTQVCRQIKDNTDHTTRYHMMDFLVGLAAADSEFAPQEERCLNSIRNGLGINMGDYLSMRARYGFGYGHSYGPGAGNAPTSRPSQDPYKVLGLSDSATDDEVKKAYRRLAMKYHPDKVATLSEEMQQNAAAQFREINEAYEFIKSQRGFK